MSNFNLNRTVDDENDVSFTSSLNESAFDTPDRAEPTRTAAPARGRSATNERPPLTP